MIGRSLGPYKVVDSLGSGGMGEVYLAEDTRLGRKVAIKVLPAEFAGVPERLARFEQEARAAAALNHPHIAVVHDIGSEPGDGGETTHFIVQEHLEGETLRHRLDKGAVPADKALALAGEIAEALGAAHGAGIVHRDLKPANIFVSPDGHAKVLDFGLAKLTQPDVIGSVSGSSSRSPTMLGTVAGQVMGTAGYMAPEQIDGEEIDHRADLFAFGCVLYEIATGSQAFTGKNVLDTLHKIANSAPMTLAERNDELPAELQRIVDKCIEKDPRDRYQGAADLNVDLRGLAKQVEKGTAVSVSQIREVAPRPAVSAEVPAAAGGIPLGIGAGLVVAALAVGALAAWWLSGSTSPQPGPLQRYEVRTPDGIPFGWVGRRAVAISPTGKHLAFSTQNGIWVHTLATGEAVPLRGAEGASRSPTFSPDGEWLVFWNSGELRRVPVTGGAVAPVAEAPIPFGVRWQGDSIVYGAGDQGLWRVADTGGEPEQLVALNEGEMGFGPQVLPGGEWVVFTLASGVLDWDAAQIVAQSLTSGDRKLLVATGRDAHFVAGGHLVYALDNVLMAAPFDADAVETTGGPVALLDGVALGPVGTAVSQISIADNGTLAYLSNTGSVVASMANTLEFVDRGGSFETLPVAPQVVVSARLSPSGDRVAVTSAESGSNWTVWAHEIATQRGERLSQEDGLNYLPIWEPSGDALLFTRISSAAEVAVQRVPFGQGAEATELLDGRGLMGMSADGREMLVIGSNDAGAQEFGVFSADDEEVDPVPATGIPVRMGIADISADGRLVAWVSTDTGADEIFAFDRETDRSQIVSTNGGTHPVFSDDGRTLYYVEPGAGIMASAITLEPRFSVGAPEQVTSISPGDRLEDIDPLTGRFLIARNVATAGDDAETPHIVVLVNWRDNALSRVLPDGR